MQSLDHILYEDSDNSKPIRSFIGMDLGNGSPKSNYSPWVKMLGLVVSRTTIRVAKNNNCHYRAWESSSESCPWELKINFSKKTNSRSVTKCINTHSAFKAVQRYQSIP